MIFEDKFILSDGAQCSINSSESLFQSYDNLEDRFNIEVVDRNQSVYPIKNISQQIMRKKDQLLVNVKIISMASNIIKYIDTGEVVNKGHVKKVYIKKKDGRVKQKTFYK